MMRFYFPFFAFILFFFSCTSNEEKNLISLVEEDISIQPEGKQLPSNVAIRKQYEEIELNFNKQYICDMKKIIENNFEEQLEIFEDEELGFFKTYGYMFAYVLKSDQEWEDEMRLKSNKYFNPLIVEQKLNTLYEEYVTDIKQLRMSFISSSHVDKLPTHQIISLSDNDIDLSTMRSYSGRNLLIEVGTEIFVWLIGLLIAIVLSFAVGFVAPPSWVITILAIIISIILSYSNDKKLLNSLREQHIAMTIDYESIESKINNDTKHFYEVK